MITIGFAGRAGVGKTTAAATTVLAYLRHPRICMRSIQVRSFAAPLKAAAQAVFGDAREDWQSHKSDAVAPGVVRRSYLQWCGESHRLRWGPRFWVDREAAALHALRLPAHAVVVYDDVRNEEEADHVRKNSGLMIHLEREGKRAYRGHRWPLRVLDHTTEWPLHVAQCDAVVDTTGDGKGSKASAVAMGHILALLPLILDNPWGEPEGMGEA
jgi:hypothetical protein